MDNQVLLENLRNNLIVNRELYQSERYQKLGFWGKIQEHDESLSSNYGHKILWTEDEIDSNLEDK